LPIYDKGTASGDAFCAFGTFEESRPAARTIWAGLHRYVLTYTTCYA